MSQEYKLTSVQIDKEPFLDNFGNTWLTVAFEGISEPVRWVVKEPNNVVVGETYYGEVKDATSKAGKSYRRFHKEQRPDDAGQTFSNTTNPKKEWTPRDDSAIQAQWAIGQAVQVLIAKFGKDILSSERVSKDIDLIETTAKSFFAMIDRVKSPEAPVPAPTSGYEKAVAQRSELADRSFSERDIPNFDVADEISLADIPF